MLQRRAVREGSTRGERGRTVATPACHAAGATTGIRCQVTGAREATIYRCERWISGRRDETKNNRDGDAAAYDAPDCREDAAHSYGHAETGGRLMHSSTTFDDPGKKVCTVREEVDAVPAWLAWAREYG